jgi:FtsP/CotA-like multicopper oxidase with cupredoxin domain
MRHKSSRVLFALALGAAGVVLTGSPASAQPVVIDLCAGAGTLALPDGASAPVWGFAKAAIDGGGAATCAGVAPQVPGPVLDVPAGDTVQVVVHNDLAQPVSFEAPGQSIAEGATAAAPHSAATFTFTASAPGTYLYESAGNAGRQLAMGLYGALIVRPGTAGRAYDSASTAYDVESVLVLSAVDPAFNADPDHADPYAYTPRYWLINGKAYPQTDPVHAAGPGTRVLLRFVNAGHDNTTMAVLGLHERVIARDAHPLNNPFDATAETVPAGATEDTIATIPASGTKFALYNRQLHLTNGAPGSPSHTPGGMMTFIQVP